MHLCLRKNAVTDTVHHETIRARFRRRVVAALILNALGMNLPEYSPSGEVHIVLMYSEISALVMRFNSLRKALLYRQGIKNYPRYCKRLW